MTEQPHVVVEQTREGEQIEFTGKRSYQKRTIRINREWTVTVDGAFAGMVHYRLLTRERKTPGQRCVNSRWQAPGWEYVTPGRRHGIEAYSKTGAIKAIVQHAAL